MGKDESSDEPNLGILQDLFGDAMSRPLAEFAVSPEKAAAEIDKRITRLKIFAAPNTPSQLRELFSSAVKSTAVCHELAEGMLAISRRVEALPRYSTDQLLMIARLNLDRDPKRAEDTESLAVRNRLLDAILEEAKKGPQARLLKQLLTDEFSDAPEYEKLVANYEAVLLFARLDALKTTELVLRSSAAISLMSRGLFYVTIVGEAGARLERFVTRKKLAESVEDVLQQIVSGLIGLDLLAPIKTIVDVISSLIEKERALEEMHDEVTKLYAAAEDYVMVYTQALLIWSQWAGAIVKQTIANEKTYRDHFSADLLGDDVVRRLTGESAGGVS